MMDRILSNSNVPQLPLCSFGPGGVYVVDWQVLTSDISDARWNHPPRTIGSIVRRVAGWILWDLKGWLVAIHPNRAFRADWKPETLKSCPTCGHSATWLHWFAQDQLVQEVTADDETPETYRFPTNNRELELVRNFNQSPAGQLVAMLQADNTLNLFGEKEKTYDTNAKAVSHSDRDSGLSGSQRVFADDAGVGGPARRLKGNNLRARRGARKETVARACPEQGSLFGGLADGAAA